MGYIGGRNNQNLSKSSPLPWNKSQELIFNIRSQALEQLLTILSLPEPPEGRPFLWGDEIEYIVLDSISKEITEANKEDHFWRPSISASHTVNELRDAHDKISISCQPEYAMYQIEATPKYPFTGGYNDFLEVKNGLGLKNLKDQMIIRRKEIEAFLDDTEKLFLICSFPRLGTLDSLPEDLPFVNEISKSDAFPDYFINNTYERFPALTKIIYERRGLKSVTLHLDILDDCNGGKIHLDAMGYGMGSCCLQLTMQASSMGEAAMLYDQLGAMAPIILALSAATPIQKGHLVTIDSRWPIIEAMVDDRNEEERLTDAKIHCSRYSAISCWASPDNSCHSNLNDLQLPSDFSDNFEVLEPIIGKNLAKHFAWILHRDPLIIREQISDDDSDFLIMQSANWQSMRLKPPSWNNKDGWRVEFRVMDIQPTEELNAQFCTFVLLVAKALLKKTRSDGLSNVGGGGGAEWRIPMSLHRENMATSTLNDAVINQEFYWPIGDKVEKKSVDYIINDVIIPFLYESWGDAEVPSYVKDTLDMISRRASGILNTPAKIMREFVRQHPSYSGDGVVHPEIQTALLDKIYSYKLI